MTKTEDGLIKTLYNNTNSKYGDFDDNYNVSDFLMNVGAGPIGFLHGLSGETEKVGLEKMYDEGNASLYMDEKAEKEWGEIVDSMTEEILEEGMDELTKLYRNTEDSGIKERIYDIVEEETGEAKDILEEEKSYDIDNYEDTNGPICDIDY